MDLAVLQLVAAELNEALSGGYINKISQPLPREVVLRVRAPGRGEQRLMISADPLLGRIHLTGLKIPNPPSPPRFCAYLRAHLKNSVITGVACDSDDRVVRISAVMTAGGERAERVLVLELLGRDSNILLVDGSSGLIMECLHRIPEIETKTRAVLPGREYVAPPKRRSGALPALPRLKPEDARPGITSAEPGKQRLTIFASAPNDRTFSSMNHAADAFYRPRIESLLLEGFRRNVAAPLKARIRSLDRRIVKIQEDRRRMSVMAARQEEGELLKANLYKIRKGMRSLEVEAWDSTGARMIELDPALDGVANMKRIFKNSARGRRGVEKVAERLKQSLEEKAALEDQLFHVEISADFDELSGLAGEETGANEAAVNRRRTRPAGEKRGGQGAFREFHAPSGAAILVGKSGKGNDYILKAGAAKGGVWFHAKGVPGAHVILVQGARKDSSPADEEFAAGLAVRFSKAGGKGKAEVMIADVKDVKRPKGALPGQVTVSSYRTIMSEGAVSVDE
jgi:predicted ribosome quality control (RQC) complex YloA/Tae2 family protein